MSTMSITSKYFDSDMFSRNNIMLRNAIDSL